MTCWIKLCKFPAAFLSLALKSVFRLLFSIRELLNSLTLTRRFNSIDVYFCFYVRQLCTKAQNSLNDNKHRNTWRKTVLTETVFQKWLLSGWRLSIPINTTVTRSRLTCVSGVWNKTQFHNVKHSSNSTLTGFLTLERMRLKNVSLYPKV